MGVVLVMYLVSFHLCLFSRQAREIVLKYEGRLTRTRGYQTAGADVRTNQPFTGHSSFHQHVVTLSPALKCNFCKKIAHFVFV